MADNAIPALGIALKRGDGLSPQVFTAVAEVVDINGMNLKLTTAESTHMADTWKAFKATVLEGGSVKLSINFVPTDATHKFAASGLGYDFQNKTLRTWKIVWPDSGSTTWMFDAFIDSWAFKAPLPGILRADISLLISGQPTFA